MRISDWSSDVCSSDLCLPQSNARDWLLRRHRPLVYVDQDPDPEIPSINVDDRGGARLAATHLVELGHRRIGVLTLAVAGTRVSLDDDAESEAVPHPQRERLLGTLEVLARKSLVSGKRVSVPLEPGGTPTIKKKKKN